MEFLTSTAASSIAVILSLVLFIILSYRGLDLTSTACLSAVVVAITAKSGFFPSLFGTFMTESAAFFTSIFFPFVTGGILGSVMVASGCSMSIGRTLVKRLGAKNTPYIIMILSVLLNLAGIATTPFIVVPIALSLLQASDLPKRVGLASGIGAMYTTMVTLPGVAAANNVIPTLYLGTTLTSGALMGTVCFIFSMILLIIYVKFLIWEARRCGDGFDGEVPRFSAMDMKLPNFWVSLLPIAIVVGLAVGLTSVVGDSYRAVTIGQIAASVFVVITCRKFFMEKLKDVVMKGIKPNIEFVVGISLIVGYAAVVQDTSCYSGLMNWITQLNVHPYLLTVIACGLICGICANGYGGMGIFLSVLGGQIAAMPGINAGAVHRLTTMTSSTFDSLPHASSVQINLGIWKMSVKEGYKYCFVTTVLIPILYTLLGVIMAVLFY